ncbi:caspase-3-like, partial [Notothenia coriiceps]|uniref:Caspase-3-like n=1 Tax=Notothenia coriiceps TaxID=8208 RepID=A0A6I9NE10_9TELE
MITSPPLLTSRRLRVSQRQNTGTVERGPLLRNMADGDLQSAEDTVDALKLFGKRLGAKPAGRSETPSSETPEETDSAPRNHSDPYRYKMDYPCIGTCLIINNKNFHPSTGRYTLSTKHR